MGRGGTAGVGWEGAGKPHRLVPAFWMKEERAVFISLFHFGLKGKGRQDWEMFEVLKQELKKCF